MEAMVLVIWDPLGKEYGHLPSRTLTTPKWRGQYAQRRCEQARAAGAKLEG